MEWKRDIDCRNFESRLGCISEKNISKSITGVEALADLCKTILFFFVW
jgi:hypothetical protein